MTVARSLALAAGTATVAVLALAACGDDSAGPKGYTPELRSSFVIDCAAQGTPQNQCACLYDKLEAQIPFRRYEALDKSIRSGSRSIPNDIATLAATCAAAPTG
jgi:hypothetical protein